MDGLSLIASALLIILLLPVMIATLEKKRIPDSLYLTIAGGGIGFAMLRGGLPAALLAAAIGLFCLLSIAAVIGFIRSRFQIRLLLGCHIKLLGAGATWLSASGAAAMISIAIFLFILFAFTLRARKSSNIRPEFSQIAVAAILIIQLQHYLITIS